MTTNAIATARKVARTGSRIVASTGSPRAPIPSEVSVTPNCIAAMNRGGRETILSTSRARRLPCCCSSTIFVLRAVTSPYSAATKNAFRNSSPTRAASSRVRIMPRSVPGRRY